MAWDFQTDSEYQELLTWADDFVTRNVEPLDYVLGSPYDKSDANAMKIVRTLQREVKDRGLWACHLGPELGGQGFGQVKLALLNEILGRSTWAPSIFGCQAPDSGNAEILSHYGTDRQKQRYLAPLLAGEIGSCYSMTEPHAGADPVLFTTKAHRDGDSWVINGEKWFSSEARYAAFYIVMAVTNSEVSAHKGMSMFLVPADTPGVEIVRNVGLGNAPEDEGSHAYVRYRDVRVPDDHLLGGEGQAFAIAQTRLGGGRVHHAMRTIAMVRRCFDMLCERAVSRQTRAGTLADFQLTQQKVADSWIEIEQFRLLVLRTAWLIDEYKDYRKVRKDISAVKVAMAKVAHDVVARTMQLHGAMGISNEMPFAEMRVIADMLALADGPTEVHQVTLAKEVLKNCEPGDPVFPAYHLPTRRAAARAQFAEILDHYAARM